MNCGLGICFFFIYMVYMLNTFFLFENDIFQLNRKEKWSPLLYENKEKVQ